MPTDRACATSSSQLGSGSSRRIPPAYGRAPTRTAVRDAARSTETDRTGSRSTSPHESRATRPPRSFSTVTPDDLVDPAIDLVRDWLVAAQRSETRDERAVASRLDAITGDPEALRFTMRFVDRVARHSDPRLAARELRALVEEQGVPAFLGFADRTQLRAARVVSRPMAPVVIPLARRRLRHLVGPMVVDADPDALHRYVRDRQAEGFTVNVNRLGEAVLGDDEATHRFDEVLASVADPAIDYVSVKLSSIVDHIDMWSLDATLARVAERLRALFTAARHVDVRQPRHGGVPRPRRSRSRRSPSVLAEPELAATSTRGSCCRRTCPTPAPRCDELAAWAGERARGAAVRRSRSASSRAPTWRWSTSTPSCTAGSQAPYATQGRGRRQLQAPASTRRCARADAPAVRVGVASHNLFDVALGALARRATAGVADALEIEMLQGMAPGPGPRGRATPPAGCCSTRRRRAPTTSTSPSPTWSAASRRTPRRENFLHALFSDADAGLRAFDEEAERFRAAVRRPALVASPRRRRGPARRADRRLRDASDNEPDTDVTSRGDAALDRRRREPVAMRRRRPGLADRRRRRRVAAAARAAARGRRSLGADGPRRGAATRRRRARRPRRGELVATMAHEAGKTVAEGDPEVSEAVDFARYYADRGPRARATSPA